MESLIFKIIIFTGSSFSFLREDFRKEFQEQNPDVKSMRDVCVESILLVFLLIYFIFLIAQEFQDCSIIDHLQILNFLKANAT